MPEPKLPPIILDRSRLEQFATCPRQGYLMVLWDSIKANVDGYEVFDWEKDRVANADVSLINQMASVAHQSTDGKFAECGVQIHDLIDKAFEECKNDIQAVPEYFVDNLPKIKPNMTPMAIRHARHVADMVADYHVAVIGLELQISLIIIPEKSGVVAYSPTMQKDFDAIQAGKDGELVAIDNPADIKEIKQGSPAVIATTRIDLLGSGKGNLHVCDWKTGYKRRSNSETAESFQAECIALLLFNQKEYKEINTIHFWYYETMWGTKAYARFDRNEEHPRMPGLTTEVALKGRVTEAAKLFIDDCRDAWPLPESCAWCDMIRFCPQANMDAKEIADDPKAFVDNLVVLQALLKVRKKIATAWCKAKGAIEGTKVVYEKTVPQNRFTCDFADKDKPKGPAETGKEELDSHFR